MYACLLDRKRLWTLLRYFMTIYVCRVTDTLVTQTKTLTINCCRSPTCRPNAEQSNCFPLFSWNAYNNRTCVRVSSRTLSSPNSHNHLWLLSSNKERNSINFIFMFPFLSLLLFTICNVCLLGQSSNRSPQKLRWFFCRSIFRNSTP